ncbi:hypothetical protein JCM5350_000490 [Sporobolomyces pararoseus]
MSKYASLPDIDLSGSDVFETPDLPPQHAYSGDSDSEDEYLNRTNSSPATTRRQQAAKQAGLLTETNINQDRLDAKEARERFGRVERERNEKQAREQPTRTRRRLPSTEEYVLEDEREKESPLERLRRLRSEVAELEDEVRRNPTPPPTITKSEETEETSQEKGKGKKREVSPAVILQQLQMLRGDLRGLEPKLETGVLEGTGEKEDEGTGEFESKAKASLGLLNRLGKGLDEDSEVNGTNRATVSDEEAKPSAGEGELERRLAELEKLIGANEADIDETNSHPVPLVATLSRLDHLLTLLTQPRHLDSISRRVKVLTSDLERIHESRRKLGDTRPLNVALQGGVMTLSTTGGSGSATSSSSTAAPGGSTSASNIPPDALQKIDSLFSLLPRIDPLLPLAPRLLTRLRSLQSLHQSSATFSTTLSSLQTEVSGLSERKEGLEQVLNTLEESFKGNQEKFEGNLKGLETRLEGLAKRLDDLNR